MARPDRHSKLVGIFKVTLPLVGLALMATLFLVARRVDPQTAIPFAKVDVEELLRDPRMTAPIYAGMTSDGAAIHMKAKAARPAQAEQQAGATDVTVTMDMANGGGTLTLLAGEAELANGDGELRLMRNVDMTTSSGYRLIAPAMIVNLDRSGLASVPDATAPDQPEEVKLTGAFGEVTAQRFTLTPDPESDKRDEPSLLLFSGGVKLLYLPSQ